jgi:hypothetical protein
MPRPARLHAPFTFASFATTAAFATFAALVLAPAEAHAQATLTIALSNGTSGQTVSLPRLDSNLQSVEKRNPSLNPEGVNLQDCRDNQYISFPLTITGTGNLIGEVWATDTGAACNDPVQRTSTAAQCYKIPSARFIITPTQTVNISVREMIKGIGDQSAVTDASGCRQINLSTIDVWFLALSGSTATAQLDVPIKVSTLGPQPLSGVRALPGDTRISIAWDAVGEGGAADVVGVVAYCDGDPQPVGATDGGTQDVCTTPEADPDADAAETPEPTCTTTTTGGSAAGDPIPAPGTIDSNGKACATSAFTPASGKKLIPDRAFNEKYQCGSLTGTGNTVVADRALENGKVYAVAVAATDSFGNVGELSAPICQFPEATSDFWRDYRNGGGQSGGGFCSVDGPGVPATGFGLVMMGVVVGLTSWRRARRNARGRNVR